MTKQGPESVAESDAYDKPERSRLAKIGRLLLHPVETVRTAPLGASFMAIGVTLPTIFMAEFANHPAIEEGMDAGAFATWIYFGAMLMSRQLKLRARIEQNVSENGYDERFFEPLTDEWCARQTVHATLADTELLGRYKDLCQRQEDTAQLRWLPHI